MENKIVGKRFHELLPRGATTDNLHKTFHAKNVLFYIEKSPNSNCVIYEANLDTNGKLIDAEPIKVYWVFYAREQIYEEELNLIERNTAYGKTVTKNETLGKEGHHTLKIVSLPAYEIDVFQDETGMIHAQVQENGETYELLNIWVDVGSSWGIPTVNYIDIKVRKVVPADSQLVPEIIVKRIKN